MSLSLYESESDSASDSSLGPESSLPARPIFLKKNPRAAPKNAAVANTALEKAEKLHRVERNTVEKTPFDGVDDSDNTDTEADNEAWRARERARHERDMLRLCKIEAEKEDAVRRRL